ncbi:MAG: flavodoxin [Oscillospiraceae bacterium]|nr:flavodoxin [Oscillospiraceae bacterium]
MTRVYYFTRTGDSEKIAAAVAAQTGGARFPVTDGRRWKGPVGFLRGGYYASAKKSLPAAYEKPQPGDVIYLCFPVWAGGLPPAVRAFTEEVGRGRITAVASSKGSGLGDRDGFLRVVDVVGPDKTVVL